MIKKLFYLIVIFISAGTPGLSAMEDPNLATYASTLDLSDEALPRPPKPCAKAGAKSEELGRMEAFSAQEEKISARKMKKFEQWPDLPRDIQKAMMEFAYTWKLDANKSPKSIIKNYKRYLQFPKPNKQFREYIFTLFKNFLLRNLTEQDFKRLNGYIFDSVFEPDISKDLNLLIRLLIILEKLDTTAKYDDGVTALMAASRHGHEDAVKLFIGAGADVNAVADEGWTAILLASRNNHKGIVKLLIDAGADVNAKKNSTYTALILASKYGHTAIANLLIDAGADVNAENIAGETALMAASTYGHEAITKLLIDAGADINAQDSDGGTPLIHASWSGHIGIVNLLIAAGARLNIANEEGKTALDYAQEIVQYTPIQRLKDIVDLLKSKGAKSGAAEPPAGFLTRFAR